MIVTAYPRIHFDTHLRQHKKHIACLLILLFLKPLKVEKRIHVSGSFRDTALKWQSILQLPLGNA